PGWPGCGTSRWGWCGTSWPSPGWRRCDHPHIVVADGVLEGTDGAADTCVVAVPHHDGLAGVAGEPGVAAAEGGAGELLGGRLLGFEEDERGGLIEEVTEVAPTLGRPDGVGFGVGEDGREGDAGRGGGR